MARRCVDFDVAGVGLAKYVGYGHAVLSGATEKRGNVVHELNRLPLGGLKAVFEIRVNQRLRLRHAELLDRVEETVILKLRSA